jgi:hypothetical protein
MPDQCSFQVHFDSTNKLDNTISILTMYPIGDSDLGIQSISCHYLHTVNHTFQYTKHFMKTALTSQQRTLQLWSLWGFADVPRQTETQQTYAHYLKQVSLLTQHTAPQYGDTPTQRGLIATWSNSSVIGNQGNWIHLHSIWLTHATIDSYLQATISRLSTIMHPTFTLKPTTNQTSCPGYGRTQYSGIQWPIVSMCHVTWISTKPFQSTPCDNRRFIRTHLIVALYLWQRWGHPDHLYHLASQNILHMHGKLLEQLTTV